MTAEIAINNNLIAQKNDFITYMRDIKKSSPNTLQAYIRDLDKLCYFCTLVGVYDVDQITAQVISDYKICLNDDGFSAASVSRALSAVRSMLQFYVGKGVLAFNPAKEIHNDKSKKSSPHILTAREIDKLLSQPACDDPKGIRDKAMLELLYATGLKASELIDMNVADVNLQLSIVKCVKGDKERVIPLYPLAVKSLANYINNARKMLVFSPDENALFVNVAGERMTRQGLWKILKNYAASANIFTPITPHTLRHSFAAHLLQNGADIHEIQEILGHSDISSTQRYAQFLRNHHKKSYMKLHPRA